METDDPPVETDEPLGDYTAAPDRSARSLDVPIIVLTVLLILLLAVIAYLLIYIPLSQGQNVGEYIRTMYEQTIGSFVKR